MTEAMEIVENERKRLKAALEEIGRMSLHDKSGQAVVVARAAINGLDVWACFNTLDNGHHDEACTFDVPGAQYCNLAESLKSAGKSKKDCKYWRKVCVSKEVNHDNA